MFVLYKFDSESTVSLGNRRSSKESVSILKKEY